MPVTVLAQRSFDHTREYEIENEDPSVLGLAAPIGSRIVDRLTGALWLKVGATDFDWADPSAAQEKEIFTRFDHNGVDGTYSYIGVGSNATFESTFIFPAAMLTLLSVNLIFYPNANGTNKSIDIFSSYGGIGEDKLTHQESASLTGINFTMNQHSTLDVTSVFNSPAAGHVAGIEFDHQNIGQTLRYLGLSIRYK